MSHTEHLPVARLVLFMVCLSITGTIVGGAHSSPVDLPQQQNSHALSNGIFEDCVVRLTQACLDGCREVYYDDPTCVSTCHDTSWVEKKCRGF
jgi:hypothetical protein